MTDAAYRFFSVDGIVDFSEDGSVPCHQFLVPTKPVLHLHEDVAVWLANNTRFYDTLDAEDYGGLTSIALEDMTALLKWLSTPDNTDAFIVSSTQVMELIEWMTNHDGDAITVLVW